MAQRRMFSTKIIDSDAFMDMPASAQSLYFHLCMRADDEGFVGNPKKIMRMVGVNEDDLKVLLAKRFILSFETGIVVIKHWLIHNTIRMDRFSPTSYQEEKKLLLVKENKAYSEWQPNGNQLETQVKLSKDKLSKDSVVAKSDTPFSLKEEIQKLYDNPRRDLNILGLFFEYRQPVFENGEQYKVALKRHLKSAGQLQVFSDTQIIDAMDYAKREYKDIYTLETILKILTK